MINLFFTGLALLGLWLSTMWDALGFTGQAMLIVALLLIASGCIGILRRALAERWQARRVKESALVTWQRREVLCRAVEEAHAWGNAYWESHEREEKEEA